MLQLPPFNTDKHMIFLGLTGSHAYGMARPDSDVDGHTDFLFILKDGRIIRRDPE